MQKEIWETLAEKGIVGRRDPLQCRVFADLFRTIRHTEDRKPTYKEVIMALAKANLLKKDVFLGGTIDHGWRERLIPALKAAGLTYYHPVIKNHEAYWDEKNQEIEQWHRENDRLFFALITPDHRGFYTFAELMDVAHKRKGRAYMVCRGTFDLSAQRSLIAVGQLLMNAKSHFDRDINDMRIAKEIWSILVKNGDKKAEK